MGNLCELCGLEDQGTVPCAKCQRWVCIYCSLVGIRVDEDGSLLTEVVPEGVEVLCTECNPPRGGARSRLRIPPPIPTFGLHYDPHREMESVLGTPDIHLLQALPG